MPYPDHLLARGETIVLHKHPHWKVLALPVVWLIADRRCRVIRDRLPELPCRRRRRVDPGRHRGRAAAGGVPRGGAVRQVADRALRPHRPARVLPRRLPQAPRAPDPARPDPEPRGQRVVLGAHPRLRDADRGVGGRPAAVVLQRRVAAAGAGSAQPAHRRRPHRRPAGGGPGERYDDRPPYEPGYDDRQDRGPDAHDHRTGGPRGHGTDDRYYPPDDTSTRRIPQMRDQQGRRYDS